MERIPLSKAFLIIFLSTLFVSGPAAIGVWTYQHLKSLRESNEKYRIVAIVQPGPLKTEYFAELLELSVDKPKNLYKFNLIDAQKKLLASPLIKNVALKKVIPGTLMIDYQVRRPIAFIGDYSNTAMDDEGVLIPFKPFFTPKKLPEIILGVSKECKWGCPLTSEHKNMVLALLQELPHALRIDVSNYNHPSYGQRQIVIVVQQGSKKQILRLNPKDYKHQLKNYHLMTDFLAEKPDNLIIDLRIPNLAYF